MALLIAAGASAHAQDSLTCLAHDRLALRPDDLVVWCAQAADGRTPLHEAVAPSLYCESQQTCQQMSVLPQVHQRRKRAQEIKYGHGCKLVYHCAASWPVKMRRRRPWYDPPAD